MLALAALFAGILLPLLVFGSLAAHLRAHDTIHGDMVALRLMHHYTTPQRDSLVAFATILGGWLALPALLAMIGLLRWLGQPRGAVNFALTVSGAWLLNLLAKAVYRRARPDLWPSPTPRSDYGFPSGHAMMSIAIVTALMVLLWPTRLRWPVTLGGAVAVLLIGLSRLYLGVHYPSDVIAGWSAGLIWCTGLHLIMKSGRTEVRDEWPQWLQRHPVADPLKKPGAR